MAHGKLSNFNHTRYIVHVRKRGRRVEICEEKLMTTMLLIKYGQKEFEIMQGTTSELRYIAMILRAFPLLLASASLFQQ